MGTNLLLPAAAGALGALGLEAAPQESATRSLPKAFDALRPLGERVHPITAQEFAARHEHAQAIMASAEPGFEAMYITSGSALYYFTGFRWGLSERLMAFVLPRRGDPLFVCPAFEAARLRELAKPAAEIRTWEEDEDPYALVVGGLADRGVRTGRVAIEERVPFFFYDGLRRAGSGLEFASANPVTIGCRGVKSVTELDLMRLACAATVDCYRAVFASLHEGMTERDVNALLRGGFGKMGLEGGALVLFGQWAAQPHGTTTPQKLREGDIVLIDGGTSVEGYASDVTRMTVLGTPAEKHRRAFDTVHHAQEAALEAACAGRLSGTVDDAARGVIAGGGYPGGYQVFTHGLCHGIGLDGHEWTNFVKGNKTKIQPGMCFSDEPTIAIYGEFGVRLEDCLYITENGPKMFTKQSPAIDQPFG